MSKVLFINGNLHGHINPTLPVVKELVRRGEEIYYFSTVEFQKKLEAAGAHFMDYGDKFYHFLHSFQPHGNHPFYTLMEYMLAFDRTVVPIVLKEAEQIQFDYIIYDVMFGGGNILAWKLNIPAIASCSSFVMEQPPIPARMLEPGFHLQLDILYEEIKAAQSEWGIASLQISDLFFKKADLILAYTSRLFQPLGNSFGAAYRFVGPSIQDREEVIDFPLDSSRSRKLVYVSFGTVNNNCRDIYQMCFEAFQEINCQVIVSVGNKTNLSDLIKIPDNFIVRNYIPQLEVLKHTDVFISHGGLNSVSEAFYYDVPVIAVPMANDQPAVAKRLTELGAGLMLKKEELTPALLKQSVETILNDPCYQLHSREIGDSLRQSGGYRKAADEILDYVRGKCL